MWQVCIESERDGETDRERERDVKREKKCRTVNWLAAWAK